VWPLSSAAIRATAAASPVVERLMVIGWPSGFPIRSSSVSIQWAGLGPEILLELDRERPEPLRAQLERRLRDAIRSGRLQPGERLPSSREMARELGVSRGLVLECYTQLQAEGYLTSRGGSATRVASSAEAPPGPPPRPAPPVERPSIDFKHGHPDLASFPRRDWAWAVREACRSAPAAELGYGAANGSETLRRVLAAYLRRVRGAVAEPERIVICSGVQQGMNLVTRALAKRGVKRVGFEDPGHPDHRGGLALAGIEAVPVPVDDRGVDVEALAASGARAVVLTPAHQSPTGALLAPERRQALLSWAAERDATIVEDDYDAEFRYDREPVGTLQGLAPERVATLGSVSKSLAPGLRLGWVVCPPRLVDAVVDEKRIEDRSSPALDQLALAALIESGRYDRHLRRMRAVYAGKRRALVAALQRHAPAARPVGLAAGFHVVVPLPDGAREREVVAAARARSVGVYALGDYRVAEGVWPQALVLGFGNLGEGAIERGIATIGDLLDA
jgi:GntR family transcriptional regulator/MocR family aminotransferase